MDAHIETYKTAFFFDNDLARRFWETTGHTRFDDHYKKLIDEMFREKEPTYKILHLTQFKKMISGGA